MHFGKPGFDEICNLGCKSTSKILLAYETYMELCEVHTMKDVQFHFNEELDIIFITVEGSEVFVPVSKRFKFTTEWINGIHQNISPSGITKTFSLVIRDSDGTSVVYRLSNELVPPPSPETTKKKKLEEEKSHLIATEIRKQIPELYAEALSKKT